MGDKDKFELEKSDNHVNYHSPDSMPSDWRFSSANIANSSLGLVPTDNQMPVCREDLVGVSSCSSASMVDSFGPGLWDHTTNPQNLGFSEVSVQNNASTSNPIGIRKSGPASLRTGLVKTLDIGWNPPSSMLKGGIFLPTAPGVLPQSLSQFPADSAFIERAARFSCFNGGNFSDIVNPFGIPESMHLYSRGGGMMQGPQEFFAGTGLKSVSGGQGHKNVMNMGDTSKATSLSVEPVATEGSPLKNGRKIGSLVRSHDEGKLGAGGSGNESEEADFSGGGCQKEQCMLEGNGGELSAKSLGSKKRKRNGQVETLFANFFLILLALGLNSCFFCCRIPTLITAREPNNLSKLQRITLKFNRWTKVQLQLPIRPLGNKVNKDLKLQIHQKKNIFM